jgi:hypothetical protein
LLEFVFVLAGEDRGFGVKAECPADTTKH